MSHRLLLLTSALLSLFLIVQGAANIQIPYLSVILGLAGVFLLPGYCLMSVLFPAPPWGRIEKGMLSLGLSFCLVIMLGLLLHSSPWGITSQSWAVSLGVILLLASLTAFSRKERPQPAPLRDLTFHVSHRQVGLLVLSALIVAASAYLTVQTAIQNQKSHLTQLWMLPAEDPADRDVRVGVRNLEGEQMVYQLCLTADGREWADCQMLSLNPGEAWQTEITPPHAARKIEAKLFVENAWNQVYRYVIYWQDKPVVAADEGEK
jgi:hypothetical protein